MGATAVHAGPGALDHAMSELRMVEGFDVGLEMSGNAGAFRDMVGHMNHGGKIALLGILPGDASIDWGQVIFKGLVLKGIYGREMFETWNAMGAMLQTSAALRAAIARVIADVVPAREWERGFAAAASAGTGKIILDWTEL